MTRSPITRISLTRLLRAALALGAVVCLGGCFNPFQPRVGSGQATAEAAPAPSSPQGALRLLRWCWVNRQIAEYEELFTKDFQFVFSDVEAVDNPPILQDEEIAIAKRLFVDGTANEPRAKRIDLEFTNSLKPIADQRAHKAAPWHQQITTGVVLRAELQDQIFDISGNVIFYLVRGDSANLPDELIARGLGGNPGRWFIEEWEDKTSSGSTGPSLVSHIIQLATAPPAAGVQAGWTTVVHARDASTGSRSAVSGLSNIGPVPLQTTPAQRLSWGELMVLYRYEDP